MEDRRPQALRNEGGARLELDRDSDEAFEGEGDAIVAPVVKRPESGETEGEGDNHMIY